METAEALVLTTTSIIYFKYKQETQKYDATST